MFEKKLLAFFVTKRNKKIKGIVIIFFGVCKLIEKYKTQNFEAII